MLCSSKLFGGKRLAKRRPVQLQSLMTLSAGPRHPLKHRESTYSPQACLQQMAKARLGLQTPGAASPMAMHIVMVQPRPQPLLESQSFLRLPRSTSSILQEAQLRQLLHSMALLWGSARHCRMTSQQI